MSDVSRGPLVEMASLAIWLASGDKTRNLTALAHRLVEAQVFELGRFFACRERADQLVQRRELGAQIEVVDEGVFLVPDIDESGVEAGHDLADFPQIDVAHGESRFAFLLVQLDELLVFEQGDGDLVGCYVYD